MYELIKIENTPSGPSLRDTTIGDESVPTVSARELYEFLGVKRDFSNWIKGRIAKYQFKEEKDYITFEDLSSPNLANSKSRAQKLKEYQITLDMAKELAMVENNDKGRQARRYFIECEKEYKKTLENYIPKTLPDALEAYALELRRHEETKLLLEEAKPKADFYDIAVASSSTVDIGEAAKILKYKGTGRNNLFKFLRREGVLMKNNAPKQEYVNKGWFKLVEYKVNDEVKIKTLVYQKGLDGIRKMLNEAGLLPEER